MKFFQNSFTRIVDDEADKAIDRIERLEGHLKIAEEVSDEATISFLPPCETTGVTHLRCGDYLTDYEGIRGHERYRGNLGLMYFVTMDCHSKSLIGRRMVPTRMKRMQVTRAEQDDVAWLVTVLNRQCKMLDTQIGRLSESELQLRRS